MKESLHEGHCIHLLSVIGSRVRRADFVWTIKRRSLQIKLRHNAWIARNPAGIECSHSQVGMISVDDQRFTHRDSTQKAEVRRPSALLHVPLTCP